MQIEFHQRRHLPWSDTISFPMENVCVGKRTDLFSIKNGCSSSVYKNSLSIFCIWQQDSNSFGFILKFQWLEGLHMPCGEAFSLLEPGPSSPCAGELQLTGAFSLFLSEPEAGESPLIFWAQDFTTPFTSVPRRHTCLQSCDLQVLFPVGPTYYPCRNLNFLLMV